MARFLNVPHKEFNSARSGSILQFLTFWGFISFYFGLFGLYCFVFAFWGFFFISYRTACGHGQTKAQAPGPPNLEKIPQNRQRADQGPNLWATKPKKIACLRQQRRKSRQRADQSPNPWATKPGENCTLTATMSTRPPTGRPKPNLDLAVDLL